MVAPWKDTIGCVEEYVGLNLNMYPVLHLEKKQTKETEKKRNELKNKNQKKIL